MKLSIGPEDDEENQYLELNDFVKNILPVDSCSEGFLQEMSVFRYYRNYSTPTKRPWRKSHVRLENHITRRYSDVSLFSRRLRLALSVALAIFLNSINPLVSLLTLVGKLLWGFNAIHDTWEDIVRERIDRWQNQYGAL